MSGVAPPRLADQLGVDAVGPAGIVLDADSVPLLHDREVDVPVTARTTLPDIQRVRDPRPGVGERDALDPGEVPRGVLAAAVGRRASSRADLVAARAERDDVGQALDAALEQARRGDRVLVFGSFHTVAEALPLLQDPAAAPAR